MENNFYVQPLKGAGAMVVEPLLLVTSSVLDVITVFAPELNILLKGTSLELLAEAG